MKRPTALVALFLLPAFFLLHNYNDLFGFIPIRELLFYALTIYGVLAIACFIMISLKISAPKTSLILFIISFFILFFAPVHNVYRSMTFNSIISHYWVMLPLVCLLLLLLARKIIRENIIPGKIFTFLNLALVCLFATELATSFTKASVYSKNHNLIYPRKPLSDKYVSPNMSDTSKPDIYFFVFDEYTNNKTLKKMWGYDNSQITDWLSTNGFHIPSDTRSNYSFTVFSVSSTFNMDYIDKNAGGNGTVIPNLLKANQSLSNNETFSILKKENYSIRFIAPFNNTIEENGLDHFFDYLVDGQIPGQTLPGSLGITIMSGLKSGYRPYFKDSMAFNEHLQQKYKSVRLTVDKIKETTDSSTNRKPHFIYGHILVPHVPHLFDSSGKFLSYKQSLNMTLYDTYTAQVNYANSLIKEIVEHIKQHNKPNTIIIIEGDHGFRRFPDSLNRYDLPNFSAIYFPDKNYSRLYDTMSPVNTFRILFDQYFQQNFPMLKDSGTIVKDEY
jgi:hypothetical protein